MLRHCCRRYYADADAAIELTIRHAADAAIDFRAERYGLPRLFRRHDDADEPPLRHAMMPAPMPMMLLDAARRRYASAAEAARHIYARRTPRRPDFRLSADAAAFSRHCHTLPPHYFSCFSLPSPMLTRTPAIFCRHAMAEMPMLI